MVVTAIGWRAHAALTASGGRVEVIASLSSSFYATAGGELLWVGTPGSPLHGRAVITSDVPASCAAPGRLLLDGVDPWRPPAPARSPADPRALARALRIGLAALGAPRGLGCLLGPSEDDDHVTRRARPWARNLAAACAGDDPAFLADAARPLLGLGEGLTPSGDDFVGGALFARRLVGSADVEALDVAVTRIVADAATRTHPISARLLADLGAGEGWAPLHDLAAALAAQDPAAAVTAARRLTALGHSSGWSLHAGLMAGLGDIPNP
jgi:hypothetical protein